MNSFDCIDCELFVLIALFCCDCMWCAYSGRSTLTRSCDHCLLSTKSISLGRLVRIEAERLNSPLIDRLEGTLDLQSID